MKKELSEIEIENTEEDGELYVEYDIATYPSDNTLSVLKNQWIEQDIEIPDFQRGFVWTIKQSSLLIESFLRGLPVPPLFFFIDTDNKGLVVDGQQRLRSVLYFFEGFFGEESKSGRRRVFKLTGLNERSPYEGKTYKELNDVDKRKLDTAVLRAVNIRQLSPTRDKSSVYHIFERLNTGGTPLSPQEIRNTVYRGKIVTLLHEANDDSSWRELIGKPEPDKRDRDTEMVLRLLSLYVKRDKYESPMKRFLNDTMAENRNTQNSRANSFFRQFSDVSSFIITDIGRDIFRPKGPLNIAALDAIFVAIMHLGIKNLVNPKQKIERLLADPAFEDLYNARTADTDIVRKRLSMALTALSK